jgi:hypothetical protein
MSMIDDNAVVDNAVSAATDIPVVTETEAQSTPIESAVVNAVSAATDIPVVTETEAQSAPVESSVVNAVSVATDIPVVTENEAQSAPVESSVVNAVATSVNPGGPNGVAVKKIVFALPGDNFSSKFLISWTATMSKLWETRRYDIMISPATGSYVPFVRMTTLGLDVLRGEDQKPFNGQHFDVWITIDSDIVFTFEQIVNLIESTDEHPVVAGMYRMADLVNYAFVKDWDEAHFKEKGVFQFITPEDIEKWKKETEFKYFPVVYSGMGFMAVKKEVFDKIKYPYFDSEILTIKREDGTVIRDICSEDVSFCKKLTQAGYQIMVNTDIRVGHIKSLII